MYLMRVDHFGLVIRILYTATSVSSIAASFLLFCTCITTLASTSSDYCHCCRYIITVIRHAVAAATVIVLS